ncbi:hypothetical protein Tco_0051739 [Tanacetum coccineum]
MLLFKKRRRNVSNPVLRKGDVEEGSVGPPKGNHKLSPTCPTWDPKLATEFPKIQASKIGESFIMGKKNKLRFQKKSKSAPCVIRSCNFLVATSQPLPAPDLLMLALQVIFSELQPANIVTH